MTVALVGAAKETYTTSGSFTAAYNQAPTAGNLLVMGVLARRASSAPSCSTPSGWTAGPSGGTNAGTSYMSIFLFWKVAAGADTAPTLTMTALPTDVIIEEWSGVGPHDVDSTVGIGTNTANSGPLTTTNAADWIWSFSGLNNSSGVSCAPTWGGGSASDSDFYEGAYQIETATATQAVASIGTYTPTLSTGGNPSVYMGVGASMAFKTNVAPNAPTLTGPATTIDLAVTNRLPWTFSDPDAGDSQSAFSLRYRIGTGAWTTVTGTTPNSFWDAPPATFSAALYEWQCRTTDAQGLVGPYSASGFFTAASSPGVPSITAPTSGSTISLSSATVTWSVSSQTDYQIRKMDDVAGAAGTTVYYDSGDVVDATTRSVTLAFATNNRYEHIQVRIKTGGLWSAWADCRVYVSFTAPMVPTIVLTPNSGTASIAVVITNPAPTGGEPAVSYNDVYASSALDTEIRIATLVTPNSTWTWTRPGAGRLYTIRVVAVGSNGSTTTSV